MRIIIEDTPSVVHTFQTSQADGAILLDGGAAPAQLLGALTGGSTTIPAAQVGEIVDAGSPPSWLVEAIRIAFESEPGRFDRRPASMREGEPVPVAADGGTAPDLSKGS
jgi:hypothetical protein